MKLEQPTPNAAIRGIVPDAPVAVVGVQWYGSETLELTCKTPSGKVVSELLYSLNKPEESILSIVEFMDGESHQTHYLHQQFTREPDFGVTSVNYDFADLLASAGLSA